MSVEHIGFSSSPVSSLLPRLKYSLMTLFVTLAYHVFLELAVFGLGHGEVELGHDEGRRLAAGLVVKFDLRFGQHALARLVTRGYLFFFGRLE